MTGEEALRVAWRWKLLDNKVLVICEWSGTVRVPKGVGKGAAGPRLGWWWVSPSGFVGPYRGNRVEEAGIQVACASPVNLGSERANLRRAFRQRWFDGEPQELPACLTQPERVERILGYNR
jgi:hypothetical protein